MKIRTVKLVLLILITFVGAASFPQDIYGGRIISFECRKLPLRSVLNELHKESGLSFIYNDGLIDSSLRITCSIKEASVNSILKKILSGSDISYKLFGESSVVLFRKPIQKKTEFKAKVFENKVPTFDTSYSFTKAQIILETDPKYPSEAVQNRMEGKVAVKLFITSEGKVADAKVEHSSDFPVLDSAALSYSYKLKFKPAEVNGISINSWYMLTFLYSIVDAK